MPACVIKAIQSFLFVLLHLQFNVCKKPPARHITTETIKDMNAAVALCVGSTGTC